MNLVPLTGFSFNLVYDRTKLGLGVPINASFKGHPKLLEALFDLDNILKNKLHWPISALLSAGAYVAKTGFHGKGLAIDFDGVILYENQTKVFLYLANVDKSVKGIDIVSVSLKKKVQMEAAVSQCFGTVLCEDYNAKHKDHIHADLGAAIGYNATRSQNLIMQRILKYVFDNDIVVDGKFGNKTYTAIKAITGYADNKLIAWKELLNLALQQ